MVLYLIGTGLTASDISLKALEILKKCSNIYIESYTSILLESDIAELESLIGKDIVGVDRYTVENDIKSIIQGSVDSDVSLLIIGDVFAATTHADIYLQCIKDNIPVEVVHNVSIINAVSITGLQLYRFGQTVSIPFFEASWKPTSFIDKIINNININCHTLCLLDIKVKEQSPSNLMKGVKEYEPPRFMTVNTAIEQIIESSASPVLNGDTLAIGVARLGTKSRKICSGSLKQLLNVDFGPPLHSLIICAPELHEVEQELFNVYSLSGGFN